MRPLRFLLVEDNPSHAKLVRMVLEEVSEKNSVQHMPDAVQALSYLQADSAVGENPLPDVILLDLKLPGLSGHDLLRIIKQSEALRHIPVVIMTTSRAEQDLRMAFNEYASGYIVKPMDFEDFQQVVSDMNHYWAEVSETVPR